MESELARQAQESMVEAVRLLTPEERLNAFLKHCELMMELSAAGQAERSSLEPKS